MTNQKKKTIKLTGRPPVRIVEADWPLIAKAHHKTWDGEYEFQSFRHTDYSLSVRRHNDGRAIVYGVYDHTTSWQHEEMKIYRRGRLLTGDEDIVRGIETVALELGECVGDGVFTRLSDECIQGLPAEEI